MSQRDDVGSRDRHDYFVDEAEIRRCSGWMEASGGEVLRRLLGLLDADHDALSADISSCERNLADPYLAVFSMQPYWRKTAVAFHASDALPDSQAERLLLL